MSVAEQRRPAVIPIPVEPRSPVPEAPVAPDVKEPASPPAYRGDVLGIGLWFAGALILVLLHIVDALYWWFHR